MEEDPGVLVDVEGDEIARHVDDAGPLADRRRRGCCLPRRPLPRRSLPIRHRTSCSLDHLRWDRQAGIELAGSEIVVGGIIGVEIVQAWVCQKK